MFEKKSGSRAAALQIIAFVGVACRAAGSGRKISEVAQIKKRQNRCRA